MLALLVQQGLAKALAGKKKLLAMMLEDSKEELDLKVLCVIQLYLADEVLREVIDEVSMVGPWLKLESLYMT